MQAIDYFNPMRNDLHRIFYDVSKKQKWFKRLASLYTARTCGLYALHCRKRLIVSEGGLCTSDSLLAAASGKYHSPYDLHFCFQSEVRECFFLFCPHIYVSKARVRGQKSYERLYP